MAKAKPKDKLYCYTVFCGFSITIIPATSVEDARRHMLINMGYERKPWVAKDWKIRRTTAEDRQRYGAYAGPAAREKLLEIDFDYKEA